ncbi:MAG: hypothetical protein Kow0080_24410 [Candidatus Promineifilaceae bacterium]
MSQQTQTKRTFGQRLWWIIRAFSLWALLMAIVIGLAVGGFWVFTEMQRSFASVDVRISAIEQNQELLRNDVNGLMANTPDQATEIAALKTEVNRLQGVIASLEEELTNNATSQEKAVTLVQEQVNALAESLDALSTDSAAISEAFVALQSDINTNSQQIDALGGDLDALRSEVEAANTAVTTLQTTALIVADNGLSPEQMQETLALLHIWHTISRARLRLAENNLGLATDDVMTAMRRIDVLTSNAAEAEQFALVEARLALALSSLPNDPETAASDLDNAWNVLDNILVTRLQPDAVPVETATETTPAILDENSTTEETAVSEPSPEPTPEPTPTPTSP